MQRDAWRIRHPHTQAQAANTAQGMRSPLAVVVPLISAHLFGRCAFLFFGGTLEAFVTFAR